MIPASASRLSGFDKNGRQFIYDPPNDVIGIDEHYTLSGWQDVKPGDRLWVRETFSGEHCWQDIPPSGWGWDTMRRPTTFWYWADGNPQDGDWTRPIPSIHMPRWASRLTLIVEATKIERLQQISEADAAAEGIVDIPRSLTRHGRMDGYGVQGTPPEDASTTRVNAFHRLWCGLHGNASWNANPYVVALTVRVIRANIDSEIARAA